jgi:hypothetical protein
MRSLAAETEFFLAQIGRAAGTVRMRPAASQTGKRESYSFAVAPSHAGLCAPVLLRDVELDLIGDAGRMINDVTLCDVMTGAARSFLFSNLRGAPLSEMTLAAVDPFPFGRRCG